uniref:Uncharacterized protein n=1 Tax=Maylandia zebra TaxID=106582 RepID=A0A3P9BXA0_9CICH
HFLVISAILCLSHAPSDLPKKMTQQEGRAMATLDRQIPSPDTFLCEPWSSFVSAAKLRFVDCKFARRVALISELSALSSQCPALEDFSLVVCHVCSKVVTPQGILTHYGKPHTYTNPLRQTTRT